MSTSRKELKVGCSVSNDNFFYADFMGIIEASKHLKLFSKMNITVCMLVVHFLSRKNVIVDLRKTVF